MYKSRMLLSLIMRVFSSLWSAPPKLMTKSLIPSAK